MKFVPNGRLLWLAALIVVPATTLAVRSGGIVALGCVLVCALLLVFAILDLSGSRRRLLAISLEVPEILRCTKNRESDLVLTVSNTGSAPIRPLRYGLSMPPSLRVVDELIQAIDELPGESKVKRAYAIKALKRGRFHFSAVHFETVSSAGLWLIRRDVPVEIEIRVYPDLTQERKRLAALFLHRGNDGKHALRQIGKGREFEQMREYAPGDDYVDIDWKATARRNMPVTRTYQIERTQEVYVVVDHSRLSGRELRVPVEEEMGDPLDLGESSAGGEFAVTTELERFLHCSLILASVAQQQGDLFGFVSFADKVDHFIRSKNGASHYNIVRDALYTLEPKQVAPDFEELMISLRQRLTRRALIVMLVDLSDPLTAEQFFQAIPLISKQHLILVNMVRPEKAHSLFSANPTVQPERASDLYENLGGHFQWADLKETGKLLKQYGVELGIPEHEELCTEAVTQYLNVKRRQIL